jgi:hypothetical protein
MGPTYYLYMSWAVGPSTISQDQLRWALVDNIQALLPSLQISGVVHNCKKRNSCAAQLLTNNAHACATILYMLVSSNTLSKVQISRPFGAHGVALWRHALVPMRAAAVAGGQGANGRLYLMWKQSQTGASKPHGLVS